MARASENGRPEAAGRRRAQHRRAVGVEVPLRRFEDLDERAQQAIIRDVAAVLVSAVRADLAAADVRRDAPPEAPGDEAVGSAGTA